MKYLVSHWKEGVLQIVEECMNFKDQLFNVYSRTENLNVKIENVTADEAIKFIFSKPFFELQVYTTRVVDVSSADVMPVTNTRTSNRRRRSSSRKKGKKKNNKTARDNFRKEVRLTLEGSKKDLSNFFSEREEISKLRFETVRGYLNRKTFTSQLEVTRKAANEFNVPNSSISPFFTLWDEKGLIARRKLNEEAT